MEHLLRQCATADLLPVCVRAHVHNRPLYNVGISCLPVLFALARELPTKAFYWNYASFVMFCNVRPFQMHYFAHSAAREKFFWHPPSTTTWERTHIALSKGIFQLECLFSKLPILLRDGSTHRMGVSSQNSMHLALAYQSHNVKDNFVNPC